MHKANKPLYGVWASMRGRCNTPSHRSYKDYGGRGIKVCARWDSYAVFEADMSPRPQGKFSLDRIDNDGDYSPENCRWASRTEQQRNQRVTRRVIIEGVEYVAADLADRSGLKTDTIVERAAQGLKLSEVLDAKRRVFVEGLAKGGRASGDAKLARTHCKNGHEFRPETTYVNKFGWRQCNICHAEKMRRLNAAKTTAGPARPATASEGG